jgi:hypothetical protein
MQSSGSVRGNKLLPGIKIASLQALKLEATSRPTQSQGFKLQARVYKLQDPSTRVQAHKPTLQGASNEDKSIFCMLHVEANLVG